MKHRRVLGIDPAISSPTGICLLVDGQWNDWLALTTNPKDPEERRIAGIAKQCGLQIVGSRATLVCIEQPYVATWERGKTLNAKADTAMQLTKLVQAIAIEATKTGAAVVMVDPADGFKALTGSGKGDKSTHVKFANMRSRSTAPLTEAQHHLADAYGVALAGEARANALHTTAAQEDQDGRSSRV